jgi:hypothetical protein
MLWTLGLENILWNIIETCLLNFKLVLGTTKHDRNIEIDPR